MQLKLTLAVDGFIILRFCLFITFSTAKEKKIIGHYFPSQGWQGPPGNFPGLTIAGAFSGKAAHGCR